MAERAVFVKIGVKERDAFIADLRAMGGAGETMARRIEGSAVPASRSLVALSAAAGEARVALTAAGSGLGPLSAGLGALGGAAGVVSLGLVGLGVGFVALTKRALDSADAIGDAADSLGLSVKAYQTYSSAAKLAGVSAEQFEGGVKILQDRLQNAAAKGGEAAAPFRTLGVAFRTASGEARGAEDVFEDLAEAFSNIENPAQRVSLAIDAFGKSGAKFLPLFADGAAGIRRFAAEAQALGLIIDESLIRNAGAANDKLDTMGTVISTKLTQAFLNVAPYVDKFASFLLMLSGDETTRAKNEVEDLGKRLGVMRSELERLVQAQSDNPRGASLLQSRVDQLTAEIRALEQTRSALRQGLAANENAPTPANTNVRPPGALTDAELDELKKKYLEVKGAVDPAAKAQQDFAEKTGIVQKAVDANLTSLEEAQRIYGELAAVRDREIADADKMGAQLVKAWENQEKRNAGVEKYIVALEDHATAAGRSAKEEKVLNAITEAQNKLVDELGNRTRDLTEAEKERIRTAVESKTAFDEAQKRAEDFQRDQERMVERAADRLVDAGADALFDYMEGRSSDLWSNFTTWGKRAFAQLLAEQFLRPLAVNIVSGALGVPQSAAQQASGFGSGLLQSTAQNGLSKALGLDDMFSNVFGSMRSFLQPGGDLVAKALPSLFGWSPTAAGATVGLTSSAAAESLGVVAGMQTSVAGPFAAAAPFVLPALAVALPFLLSSIFGSKKSVGPNGNAIINYEVDASGRLTKPGGLEVGGLGADNGGDKDYARRMGEAAVKGVNAIVDRLGARLLSVPGSGLSNQLEVGYFAEGNKHFSIVDGEKAEFSSAEEAVADFIKRALQKATIEGLSDTVREGLKGSKAATVEELGADIDYASTFDRRVALASAGPGTRSAQLLGLQYAAEDAALAGRQSRKGFVDKARTLFGEDSTRFADAKATSRSELLTAIGLGPRAEGDQAPLEGMAVVVQGLRASLAAYRDELIATGSTADEAAKQLEEGFRNKLDAVVRETLFGMTGDQLDDAEAELRKLGDLSASAVEALAAARNYAELIDGMGPLQVELAKLSLETTSALQKEADAKADYIAGLNAEISSLNTTAAQMQGFADSLAEFKRGLIAGDLSPLGRPEKYGAATADLNSVIADLERDPTDIRALARLQSAIQAHLVTSRDVNASGQAPGSSAAYRADFNADIALIDKYGTLAEREATLAAEQRDLLKASLEQLTGQSGDLRTLAEVAETWRQAQEAMNGGGASGNGGAFRKLFDDLAGEFRTTYGQAKNDTERQAIYSATAQQRDAILAAAPSDVIQEILRDYYQGSQDPGAVFGRLELIRRGVTPRYASGTGMGTAEGWAWVGEQGPELAYFEQSARIYRASESKSLAATAGAGAGGVNVERALGAMARSIDGLAKAQRETNKRLDALALQRADASWSGR